MHCPKCASSDTKVMETRDTSDQAIRRRRQCLSCGYRFTTLETIVKDERVVIKRDGHREPFQVEKIEKGIRKAVEKCGIEESVIQNTIQEVVEQLYKDFDQEIPSSSIGEQIMKVLQALNPIAYVRFASVCKAFKNLDDLNEAIQAMRPPTP